MQEKKKWHQIAGLKNAGKENAAQDCKVGNAGTENSAQDCRGVKCRKGKCGTKTQGWKMREK